MTAVPNWDITTDADLAVASAAGDRQAFADIYDRYADRLHDFCIGMLGDRDAAADCVQDAFCTAATRLSQLRDSNKLRPWLYSIARNEALRRLRDRRRETPSDELPDTATDDAGPETLAARAELADLIAEAAGGLSDRDRCVLELAFRHGMSGADLADALGVTTAYANTVVHRLRDTIERSLGALLVSRRARNAGRCAELAAMLEHWDGHFNVLMRKRISRHIESCDICDDERRRLVNPVALLGATPVFIPAPAWLRDETLSAIHTADLPGAARPADDGERRRWPNGLFGVALLLAVLGASGGLALVWFKHQPIPIAPAEINTTLPVPSPTPTAPNSLPLPPTATPSPNATVQAPMTTTVKQAAPSAPPVDDSPPPRTRSTPEVTGFEPPPPPPPVSRRPSSRSTPTSDEVRPPGIAGVPPDRPVQEPRRATIDAVPGLGGSGSGTSDGDSDPPRRRSTRP